ncbi:MAG: hypothetical protein IPI73_12900 [Betaproteobacteria bacterium]|nr:hypothetical protein [Betaproteobacteria bacterium]
MKKGTPSTPMARALFFPRDGFARLRVGQAALRLGAIQAGRSGDRDQVFSAGQVDAVDEVGVQERLLDPVLQAVALSIRRAGERDQAVGGKGIGLADDALERERDAMLDPTLVTRA